jgi:hypothetical protein
MEVERMKEVAEADVSVTKDSLVCQNPDRSEAKI